MICRISPPHWSWVICGQAAEPGRLWLWWRPCCFRLITMMFPCFIAVKAFLFSRAVLPVLLICFSLFLSFVSLISIFALPPFCSFCFLPPNFHRLIAVSGSSALQPVPRDPASLPGRVMYEWLALTSLQAQRHSHSVLPGLLFLALSFFPSVPLPYSFSSLSSINHLSLRLLSLPVSLPLWYLLCFTASPSPHPFLYLVYHFPSLWLMLKRTLASLLCPPSLVSSHPFMSFLFSSKAASSLPFFYLFLSLTYKYTEGWHVWGKQTSSFFSHVIYRLIPIQLHLSRSTLFLDNAVS